VLGKRDLPHAEQTQITVATPKADSLPFRRFGVDGTMRPDPVFQRPFVS